MITHAIWLPNCTKHSSKASGLLSGSTMVSSTTPSGTPALDELPKGAAVEITAKQIEAFRKSLVVRPPEAGR